MPPEAAISQGWAQIGCHSVIPPFGERAPRMPDPDRAGSRESRGTRPFIGTSSPSTGFQGLSVPARRFSLSDGPNKHMTRRDVVPWKEDSVRFVVMRDADCLQIMAEFMMIDHAVLIVIRIIIRRPVQSPGEGLAERAPLAPVDRHLSHVARLIRRSGEEQIRAVPEPQDLRSIQIEQPSCMACRRRRKGF